MSRDWSSVSVGVAVGVSVGVAVGVGVPGVTVMAVVAVMTAVAAAASAAGAVAVAWAYVSGEAIQRVMSTRASAATSGPASTYVRRRLMATSEDVSEIGVCGL